MREIAITDSTIAFIGPGFTGGSIARAIRKTQPDIRIMTYMRSHSRLEQARQRGVVDVILDRINENPHEYDLIPLCTPVKYSAGYPSAIRPYLEQGTLIIDMGGARCGIHEEARRQGLEYCSIGGHPMAGSEKTDYKNSTDHFLENAYCIVTPPKGKNSSHPQALSPNAERIMAVARTIGAIPLVLDYREHDGVVAAINYLPHPAASSLVNLIENHDAADGTIKRVAADGFKDITRTASSSPEIWERICMTNVEPISDTLEAYIAFLNKVLEEIREHKGQGICRLFEISRDYRNSITDKAKGFVEPSYEFTVGVSDEVGATSTISVILAVKGISIKSIGVNNSHERGEGALKITFYDEASVEAVWQRSDRYKYKTFRM